MKFLFFLIFFICSFSLQANPAVDNKAGYSTKSQVAYDKTRIIFSGRGASIGASIALPRNNQQITASAANSDISENSNKPKAGPPDFLVFAQLQPSRLLQKKMSSDKTSDGEQAFLIKPSVLALGVNSAYPSSSSFSFLKDNVSGLPQDRESLFWAQFSAFSPKDSNLKNQISFVFKTKIKFFYRPEGISGSPKDIFTSLKFIQDNGKLIVQNPTPYYVSFKELKVGETVLFSSNFKVESDLEDKGMVAPMSSNVYPLAQGQKGRVSWTIINDDGADISSSSAH